eukprot:2023854-Pyramimonas_sp.AAC.3
MGKCVCKISHLRLIALLPTVVQCFFVNGGVGVVCGSLQDLLKLRIDSGAVLFKETLPPLASAKVSVQALILMAFKTDAQDDVSLRHPNYFLDD